MAKNTIEADLPTQSQDFTIPEITAGKHKEGGIEIEAVTGMLKMDDIELMAFMEEPVVVNLNPAPGESGMVGTSLTVAPDVQWVFFGKTQTIKRKYVEVLERARSENFVQRQDLQNPAASRPVGTTVYSFPYSVVQDTAKGHAWLKHLKSQRS